MNMSDVMETGFIRVSTGKFDLLFSVDGTGVVVISGPTTLAAIKLDLFVEKFEEYLELYMNDDEWREEGIETEEGHRVTIECLGDLDMETVARAIEVLINKP